MQTGGRKRIQEVTGSANREESFWPGEWDASQEAPWGPEGAEQKQTPAENSKHGLHVHAPSTQQRWDPGVGSAGKPLRCRGRARGATQVGVDCGGAHLSVLEARRPGD